MYLDVDSLRYNYNTRNYLPVFGYHP